MNSLLFGVILGVFMVAGVFPVAVADRRLVRSQKRLRDIIATINRPLAIDRRTCHPP